MSEHRDFAHLLKCLLSSGFQSGMSWGGEAAVGWLEEVDSGLIGRLREHEARARETAGPIPCCKRNGQALQVSDHLSHCSRCNGSFGDGSP